MIFTTLTSPDSGSANMYGHMADNSTATVDGESYTFSRPKLAAETDGEDRAVSINNESWAQFNWANADKHCDILPDARQLEGLKIERGDLSTTLGWPVGLTSGDEEYWSSSQGSIAADHISIDMRSRSLTQMPDATQSLVSCVDKASPEVTPKLVISADSFDSTVNAAKVEVGDEINMKISVTDSATNKPLPYRYFNVYLGDEQNRQNQKNADIDAAHQWSDEPVVITNLEGSDGHYHGVTDANGQFSLALTQDRGAGVLTPVRVVLFDGTEATQNVIFTVVTSPDVAQARMWGHMQGVVEAGNIYKRPLLADEAAQDTHGTKVAITAALYDNASATASIDTIFTVVTSPDSDKAKMWGHMAETVAAANGEVFKRPLLSAEIASGITHGSNTENNETWGSVNFEVAKDACGAGFVPSLADLQSLYDTWPGGAMNTQQGWPLDGKNYQDSTADLSRTSENRYVKAINLRDGGIGSLLWDEKLYFVCLQNAHPVATQITLTSPQYNDSDGFAKAKVGETIPVTITTLDAQGKPVADTPVIFTRGDSIGRANQEVNGSQAAAIQINHSDARNSGVEYYTATGADGTLTLDISQDGGAGFKTPLMASIEHSNATTTAPLPVIFTVVTSPDTPKASYWGHMAETLTDSSGVVYKRPLLASEFSATPGKTLTIANGYYDKGETWGMITVDKAWNGVSGGCGRDYLPSVSNLQTLYNTWPDNAMRSRNGWPMTSSGNNNVSRYWWAGDYVISSDGAQSLYAAVNLFNDGNDVKTTTSTTAYYMQTCLVSARRAAASLTLTLAGQDEATGIAKAKKGEQIAATVTVKDAAGQPMKNVMVKISRGTSYNRANSAASASGATDDITLRNVMPSGLATSLLDTSAKYLYVETDELGQVTFTLAQDSTTGLKTTISAATMDGSNLTDSKDAIFTVITSPDVVDGSSGGGMVLTSVAPSTGSMTFNCTVSSCTSYWYGITDEDGKAQLEVTQDDSRGLRTPLQAMLVDDPLTVSDMDVIFTVITSPDSEKAKYWGHMPETVTNSAGVKFRRPLLAAEMTSNSGTYLVNNETWPLVTAANTEKAGATGCDVEYQPLSGDLQTLYGDNPDGAIGTNYGWPVAGNKSWWAADRAPNTGYYQFINLNSGDKGTASSSTATGAQVCLVEPRTSTPASITLTSTAMDGAKNAAVVEKGSAMPLTVTVKDSSGNPVANVGFTLSRGDSKNRAGTVVTDGDVAADAGADDLMLKALTPASASQSMTTTGIVFTGTTGTTGSDGTATFTLNQDKSLGLKTPLTVKLTDNTTLHASLDVIFMVLTSPDTDKALFWGNMADTTSVNGKTLHRPWLQAELLSGVTPVFTNGVHTNNEYWAMAHTVDNTKWDIAKQCGSLSKAPDNNDLLTLYHSISSLGWPTQGYPYLSKSTSSGGMYCGVDENTRNQNCAIKPASSAGYATCVD